MHKPTGEYESKQGGEERTQDRVLRAQHREAGSIQFTRGLTQDQAWALF